MALVPAAFNPLASLYDLKCLTGRATPEVSLKGGMGAELDVKAIGGYCFDWPAVTSGGKTNVFFLQILFLYILVTFQKPV